MSVCVAIKTSEGLVLGADSAITLAGGTEANKILQHGRKLFHLGDHLIGILTWGAGSIGSRNLASYVAEFERGISAAGEKRPLAEIARELAGFLEGAVLRHYGPQSPAPFTGMLVGGYSKDAFEAEMYTFRVPGGASALRSYSADWMGVSWFGMTDGLTRFAAGYDEQVEDAILSWDVSTDKKVALFDTLRRCQYRFQTAHLPLQDAIDLAAFLLNIQIGRCRLVAGSAPQCGGPIDIAVVTYKSFVWIRRKRWTLKYPSISG